MSDFRELRKMLCDELDSITKKGELSAGSLDIVDKLTHSIKSIDTIIAMEEAGYSYADRRRDSMGRYSREYMGRDYSNAYDNSDYMNRRGYSRDADELIAELHELMAEAPNERTKQEFKRFINKMENMQGR